MRQVVSDLQNNARDRLSLWVKDTIMRCQAIDLGHREIAAMVFTALTHELVVGVIKLGLSRKDFVDMMQQGYDVYSQVIDEHDRATRKQ